MEKGGVNLSVCIDRAETQKASLQVREKKKSLIAVLDPCHSISWLKKKKKKRHVQASYCLFLINDYEAASQLISPL